MIKLYLARHGQTKENLERIFQGHMPGQLTEEGIRQANVLHDELKDVEFDEAVSSDLKRTMDTMDIVLKGHNMNYHTTSLLREIDWGEWTGLKISSVDLSHFPNDVETEEMLYDRGARFLEYIKTNFQDKIVLAIGHGLINRAVEANVENVALKDIRSVKRMCNAEFRIFEI